MYATGEISLADFLIASLYFNTKDHDEKYMEFYSMYKGLNKYFDLIEEEFLKSDPLALV
jgi:hypothetical protein